MKPQTGVSCEVFMLTTSRLHFGSRYCDGTHKHLVEVGGVWKWNFFDHLGVGLQDHGNLMKVGENCDVSMWCGKTESMHFYYFFIIHIEYWQMILQLSFWKLNPKMSTSGLLKTSLLCGSKRSYRSLSTLPAKISGVERCSSWASGFLHPSFKSNEDPF